MPLLLDESVRRAKAAPDAAQPASVRELSENAVIDLPEAGAPELPRTPFRLILYYLRHGFAGMVLSMAALISTATAIETVQPYFLGRLIASLTGGADTVSSGWGAVQWFFALCTAWLLGYLFSHAYAGYASARIMGLRVRVQKDMFAHLHGHAPRYFLDNASGALVQKIRQSSQAAGVVIDSICVNFLRIGVMFGVTLAMILQQAPQLLVTFVVFVAIFAAGSALLAQRLRRYARASAKASAEVVARMVDSVSNWDTVRSFARAAFERTTLQPFSESERAALVDLRIAATLMRMVLHVFSVMFLAWLVWQSLQATQSGAMGVGTFATIVTLAILVASHIRTLGDNLFVYFEYYGILSEGLSIIFASHEIVDPPGAVPLRVSGGAVAIENLTFAYDGGAPVFEDFSLDIRPGERVGLVGPSGAGKSTLIKLLRRQFTFGQGRILIDGQNIAGVTWESLHDNIAEVPQNPSIFRRSVRDNIRYSRPDADDAAVVAAAKLAHCHEFVAARPGGYDTVVGEKGMKLSGGERQRVAIARAFLKDAPILLLDEATSSLDSEAEHMIQESLLALMKDRTVIAIAHRLSTIAHLDRIVVLEHGRIVEQGNHADLLAANGIYARLWNRQAGGFI